MNATHPKAESLTSRARAAMSQWLEADRTLHALHLAAADAHELDPATVESLTLAHRRRVALSTELGFALGACLRAGVSFDLHADSTPPSEPHALSHAETPEPAVALTIEPPSEPEPAVAFTIEPPPEPIATAPERAKPPSPPATLHEIHTLREKFGTRPSAAAPTATPTTDDSAVHHLRVLVTEPLDANAISKLTGLIQTLERKPDQALAGLTTDLANAVAARLRAAQERDTESVPPWLFPKLAQLKDRAGCAYIFALPTSRTPQHGRWDADADAALNLRPRTPPAPRQSPESLLQSLIGDLKNLDATQLRERLERDFGLGLDFQSPALHKVLEPRLGELIGSPKLKALRKAIRKSVGTSAPSTPAPPPPYRPPDDWPYWSLTRGKTAVIIGDSPRIPARDKICAAFDFARVEWPENNQKVSKQIAQRLESGTVDLVIITRFGGHWIDNTVLKGPIKADLTRWIRLEGGYGVKEVQAEMEARWRHCLDTEPAA